MQGFGTHEKRPQDFSGAFGSLSSAVFVSAVSLMWQTSERHILKRPGACQHVYCMSFGQTHHSNRKNKYLPASNHNEDNRISSTTTIPTPYSRGKIVIPLDRRIAARRRVAGSFVNEYLGSDARYPSPRQESRRSGFQRCNHLSKRCPRVAIPLPSDVRPRPISSTT